MQNPAFSWPRVASLALAALLLQACSGSKIPSLNTQMQPSSTQQRCQDQPTQSAVLSIPYIPPQAADQPMQGRLLGGMRRSMDVAADGGLAQSAASKAETDVKHRTSQQGAASPEKLAAASLTQGAFQKGIAKLEAQLVQLYEVRKESLSKLHAGNAVLLENLKAHHEEALGHFQTVSQRLEGKFDKLLKVFGKSVASMAEGQQKTRAELTAALAAQQKAFEARLAAHEQRYRQLLSAMFERQGQLLAILVQRVGGGEGAVAAGGDYGRALKEYLDASLEMLKAEQAAGKTFEAQGNSKKECGKYVPAEKRYVKAVKHYQLALQAVEDRPAWVQAHPAAIEVRRQLANVQALLQEVRKAIEDQ